MARSPTTRVASAARVLALLLLTFTLRASDACAETPGSAPDAHPDSLAARAAAHLGAGRYAEAAELAARRVEILRATGAPEDSLAASLYRHGHVLRLLSDYDGADARLDEALDIRRRLFGTEHEVIAETLTEVASVLAERGRYAPADSMFREVLALNLRLHGDTHREIATTHHNIGIVRWYMGDYTEAKRHVEAGLAMRRALFPPEHPDVTQSLTGLAAVLRNQGDYEGAEPLLREVVEIESRTLGEDHPQVAVNLHLLASVLTERGEYGAAEAILLRALAIRREKLGEDHVLVGHTLNDLANVLGYQGELARALALRRESLAVNRRAVGDEHPAVATSLRNLGVLLDDMGRLEEAEALQREALDMRRRLHGETHPRVGNALVSLAGTVQRLDRHDEAAQLLTEALAIYEKRLGSTHPSAARCLHLLGETALARGDHAAADSLCRLALERRRAALGDAHPDVGRSLRTLAHARLAAGDVRAAERRLAEAAAVFEVARVRAGSGVKRATFQASPYPELAAVRLLLEDGPGAWEAIERGHGRALADLLDAAGERGISAVEAAREDSLARRVVAIERKLGALRRAARADGADIDTEIADTRNELLEVESALRAHESDIAQRYPIAEGGAFALERIQRALAPDMAIVGWLDVTLTDEDASFGYVVRHSGPVRWETLAPSAETLPPARRLRRGLADAASWPMRVPLDAALSADATHGWVRRLLPLEPYLDDVARLVVVPSGAMLGVPVESLMLPDGGYLADRFAVSYTPSATILTWLVERGERAATSTLNALLVGDPPFTPEHLAAMTDPSAPVEATTAPRLGASDMDSLPRLPGSREEIVGLAALFPNATVLLGPDASESRLVELSEARGLSRFGTLHLATHALVDDARPEQSALVLSRVGLPDRLEAARRGDRIVDGLLSAREIVREWELSADLVTLSGCRTGLGREAGGEGYIGFAHAFLQAGARSLLLSLWKVDDEATSLLMQSFYTSLVGNSEHQPMTRADALQNAKRHVREHADGAGEHPFAHPVYWSGFILVGDPG